MLTQLLASRPIRHSPATGLGASAALHGLVIAGAVLATAGPPVIIKEPAPQHLVYLPPAHVPPRPVVAVARVSRLAAGGLGLVTLPIEVPDVLPAIGPVPSLGPLPRTGMFVFGGLVAPGATPAPGALWLAEHVEVPVTIEKGSPLPRFPAVMRSAGVDGAARFQFVVDTLGLE